MVKFQATASILAHNRTSGLSLKQADICDTRLLDASFCVIGQQRWGGGASKGFRFTEFSTKKTTANVFLETFFKIIYAKA